MTTKKANGQNTPKMEVKKQGEPKAPAKAIEAKKPTYEDLQKRIEQLENERIKKPANIQEVINFFEEKKKKINHLALFKRIKERLSDAYAEIKPIADESDFEKQEFELMFSVYSRYGKGEEIFKITNPLIIEKCIDFLNLEIDKKTAVLETEIQKDF